MKIDNNLASYCIVHTDLTLGQSNDRDSYKYYVLLRMGGGPGGVPWVQIIEN